MNKQDQRSLLKKFFTAYFHEDWPGQADTPDGIVLGYLQTATNDEARSLADAILNYSRDFANEQKIEESLFMDLGCYYSPSLEGLSPKVWLEHIAKLLMREDQTM